MLAAAAEELHDCPLYLDLHSVCASLKCTPMKHDVFRSALLNAGQLQCTSASAMAYVLRSCLPIWKNCHSAGMFEDRFSAAWSVSSR